ncbi:Transcriptional regulator, XRE family OS=Tsukamurella paurometabola (strain ATCC 8368 / DSM/ CCUG 35730 / CIP 100753 / JCM 10117 / KCTC 9821 / NBRC 16120/ NCIMB 702349 / NCTC 13040) OX=521096 GN=Tpau_1480 PE=4 SV=1 [Tsukamurella paurometabola]|uniref:Transcriptional regulator, XRE family n=1 Tax=Tsukamurella paurometabola (strain ATCC 8368 / DSM 20162 / CCUG 35730 / CIP 100753 / JCM 10117 / KCTC 9821 / NBRC 16120 / NCIMB 702349 / NCTC 13040) TaxID=521096 RepID=D5UXL5_TSUPD|nr:helix-turn-helix transcriptional regulator [Tsukamurella paurometabola]ADG78107.1 transcriptional regulator, XRE family [Tsukamurella paurometabola DSM 20162]SUP30209.1 anaerobic benzoate catabolism transcriptional regulator [Tsukamurella paurometabola]
MERRSEGEALFRHELGAQLRRLRHGRGERLADTAHRAGISPQYLSEVERGLKDPSSEMLAAITGALRTEVGEVIVEVGLRLRSARRPVLRLVSTGSGPHVPRPTPGAAARPLALAA